MKRLLNVCIILLIAATFIACKNPAGGMSPATDSGGLDGTTEDEGENTTPETDSGNDSTGGSTSNGGDGDSTEGETGSGGSGTTDGSGSGNEGEHPDANDTVITDNALNFMTDGDITFTLNGAVFSGTWTIENGLFVGTDATITIGENITFDNIRGMFETAIQFENTRVATSYEDFSITHSMGREYDNLVILISITPDEGFSFANGELTKTIRMQFDLKKSA